MAVIERLRQWVGRILQPSSDQRDPADSNNPRLDPTNVAEARSEPTDGRVSKLQEIEDRRTPSTGDEPDDSKR